MFGSLPEAETSEEAQLRRAEMRLDRLKAKRTLLDIKIMHAEHDVNFYLPLAAALKRLRETQEG